MYFFPSDLIFTKMALLYFRYKDLKQDEICSNIQELRNISSRPFCSLLSAIVRCIMEDPHMLIQNRS